MKAPILAMLLPGAGFAATVPAWAQGFAVTVSHVHAETTIKLIYATISQ